LRISFYSKVASEFERGGGFLQGPEIYKVFVLKNNMLIKIKEITFYSLIFLFWKDGG